MTHPNDLSDLATPDLEEHVRTHAQLRQEAEEQARIHHAAVEAGALELLRRNPNRLRAEVAELSGRGESWVKTLAQRAGIPTPTSKAGARERTDQRIMELLSAQPELTAKEAAAKLGLSPERIRQTMRRQGLSARPRRSTAT